MVIASCQICFDYWVSRGRPVAGFRELQNHQHIPGAHGSQSQTNHHTSSGPLVADLQNQLRNANSRATGLQNQIDAANSRMNILQSQLNDANAQIGRLQTQLNNANAQIGSLETQLGAANSRANDLQRQLDECRRENYNLKGQIAQLNTDKANLERAITTLLEAMKKKDAETLKYKTDLMDAETKIQTKLEPYIIQLEKNLTDNGLPLPPRL